LRLPSLSTLTFHPCIWVFCLMLVVSADWALADEAYDLYGSALLRYENDHDLSLPGDDRERIRFIGRLGLKYTLNDNWFVDARLSTGFKNYQYIPAIFIYTFDGRQLGRQDVYFDRYYVGYQSEKLAVNVGKVPWALKPNTDMFWDLDHNPFGATLTYQTENGQIDAGFIKPLDGYRETVGTLGYVAYRTRWQFDDVNITMMPWLVDYEGEDGAKYSVLDTAYDHRSARIAITAAMAKWTLGLDIGRAFDAQDLPEGFENETTAWVGSLSWGNLKEPGNWHAWARWFHVERFGVVTEFGQNALLGFMTSNFEGPDYRLRYRINKSWWVGARLSDIRSLEGRNRYGKRFRIEAQYAF